MQTRPQHLIRLEDLEPGQLEDILDLTQRLKRRPGRNELAGRSVGLLFFKGSLRTRASFEVAVHQLGGHTVELTASSDFWQLEERQGTVMDGAAPEHVRDAAAVLSRYFDALAIRPSPAGGSWSVDRNDAQIRAWAQHASVPVVNMESALWHPLQALADLYTMREALGELAGRRLALTWVHSPEPVSCSAAHSLLHAALGAGMEVRIANPPSYSLDEDVQSEAHEIAQRAGTNLHCGQSQAEAVDGADVIYARSWNSLEHYGNPTLAASHLGRLRDWVVDEQLLSCGRGARLMHAMPVRRNLEVSDGVLDGPASLVYQQAENRLHTQKALLALLAGQESGRA